MYISVLQYIKCYVCLLVVSLLGFFPFVGSYVFAGDVGSVFLGNTFALSFVNDFAGPLLKQNQDGEKLFDLGIDTEANLVTNMKKIFYPSGDGSQLLWTAIRNITVGVLLVFLVWAGIYFLLFAPDSEEEIKTARKNILYIVYGAALVFLVIRILGTALNLGEIQGVTGEDGSLLDNFENNVLLFIVSFLKGMAFFLAIVFLFRYGYKIIHAFSDEEKIQNAKKGIINVFLALILIKVIDYLYFIAQEQNFKDLAISIIVQVSKFVAYIGGILFVLAILYAGYQMITSGGDSEKLQKSTNILKTIFVIILVILLFLLIVYQVFNDILV